MTEQKKKDPKRVLLGKQAHDKGSRFESKLDAAFECYKLAKTASITKTPEPMRILRNLGGGIFQAVFTKKSQPDYEGTVRGGRSIIFEAKYTDKEKLQYTRVSDMQAEYMDFKQLLGARCYVLCGFASGEIYRVPWPVWQSMKETFGRKYVTEADLAEYKVAVTPAGTLLLI